MTAVVPRSGRRRVHRCVCLVGGRRRSGRGSPRRASGRPRVGRCRRRRGGGGPAARSCEARRGCRSPHLLLVDDFIGLTSPTDGVPASVPNPSRFGIDFVNFLFCDNRIFWGTHELRTVFRASDSTPRLAGQPSASRGSGCVHVAGHPSDTIMGGCGRRTKPDQTELRKVKCALSAQSSSHARDTPACRRRRRRRSSHWAPPRACCPPC